MTRNWPLVARPLPLWRGGNRAVDWALHDATSSTARYRKVTMNTASKLTLAALALTVLTTAVAQAQVNNANITATATVQQPINVTGAQSLNFGHADGHVLSKYLGVELALRRQGGCSPSAGAVASGRAEDTT